MPLVVGICAISVEVRMTVVSYEINSSIRI
jgi:hypothetical protein